MEILSEMMMHYPTQMRLGLWRIVREMKEVVFCARGVSESNPNTGKMNPKNVQESYISENRPAGKVYNKRNDRNRSGTRSAGISRFAIIITTAFLILSLSVNFGEGCGPGRGAGRRRAPRKLTPLVYKQHVPNVPENVLSASGLNEGRITRQDNPRFKALVPNYNTDIIFRDDEGTGADRLMTQRCKEKLNTLAISVMNQWPGVRLRVIEGWNEESLHALQSLHYEGRAVDITTSDKDRSKYGMLARLAVEAGFDWVYYESRAHIHCSVKSDSSQAARSGGCFSANSTVTTRGRGIQPLSSLEVGEEVLTVGPDGEPTFSPVLLFLDRNASDTREFYHVMTNQTRLTLTPSHLLYSIQKHNLNVISDSGELFSQASAKFAKNIEVGDWLLILDPSSKHLILEKVLKIESSMETGVFAPLTTTGTIIVDGVLSSCYALIDSQRLAHSAFLPIRLIHSLSSAVSSTWHRLSLLATLATSTSSETSQGQVDLVRMLSQSQSRGREKRGASESQDGIYWYASFLYSLTRRILPKSLLYDG